jgi:hypothetical protein
MSTDFEQELRARLQAHAAQIEPNPETWNRVQEGIRRGQRFRWVLAGTTAAAVAAIAAVAVLVVPGVLSPRVDFEQGPQIAGQPEEAPDDPAALTQPGESPFAGVVPVPVVVAGDDGVHLLGPDGVIPLGAAAGGTIGGVAVVPGSTVDDLDVVVSSDCALTRIVRTGGSTATTTVPTEPVGGCAVGPRFSPDGRDLAWIEVEDGGGFTLRTIGWDDGPRPVRNAAWPLEFDDGTAALESLRIADWRWRQTTATTAYGGLAMTARDAGFPRRTFFWQEVERQGDGALALRSSFGPQMPDDFDMHIVGYAGTADAVWTLQVALELGDVRLLREDDGEQIGEIVLPADVLDPATADLAGVWLSVSGETAVLGDGAGRAWTATWDGEAFGELAELTGDLDIAHGAVLGTGPAAPPAADDTSPADGDPAPGEDEQPSDQGALPDPVAERRDDLMAAAATRNPEELRDLLPEGDFSFSFGAEGDPIAYWQERQAAGEDVMGILRRILELPPTTAGEGADSIYVWPFAYDRTYSSLSSAELVALEAAIGGEAMDTYAQTDDYYGYRVGIRADGRWVFFIAGD